MEAEPTKPTTKDDVTRFIWLDRPESHREGASEEEIKPIPLSWLFFLIGSPLSSKNVVFSMFC